MKSTGLIQLAGKLHQADKTATTCIKSVAFLVVYMQCMCPKKCHPDEAGNIIFLIYGDDLVLRFGYKVF